MNHSSRFAAVILVAMTLHLGAASVAEAQLYGGVESFSFQRREDTNRVLQRRADDDGAGTATGNTEISLQTDDVDLGNLAAGRVTLGYQMDRFGLEARWLESIEGESSALVADPLHLLASATVFPGTAINIGINGDVLNQQVQLAYESHFRTADASLTTLIYESYRGQVSIATGFRAFELDEEARFSETTRLTTTSNESRTRVENQMWGPQLGFDVLAPATDRVYFSASYRTALLFNDARGEYTDLAGTTNRFDNDSQSWLNEFSAEVGLILTPRFGVHVGFQLLGLSEAALASSNMPLDPDLIGTINGVNTDDSVLYYSPVIGGRFMF